MSVNILCFIVKSNARAKQIESHRETILEGKIINSLIVNRMIAIQLEKLRDLPYLIDIVHSNEKAISGVILQTVLGTTQVKNFNKHYTEIDNGRGLYPIYENQKPKIEASHGMEGNPYALIGHARFIRG